MDGTERNVRRLVFGQQEHVFAAGHLGGAAHHDPMFGAVMMHLQRQRLARLHHDALHLEAVAGVDRIVIAPRPMNLAMVVRFRAMFSTDSRHDSLDLLGVLLVRDQDRICRLHYHHIVETHAGNKASLRMRECIGRALEHDAPTSDIAQCILGQHFPDGVPRTDIGPRGVHGYHHTAQISAFAQSFHHTVVDRFVRAVLEVVCLEVDEHLVR